MGRNVWKHRNFSALNPSTANLITMYDKKEHAKRRRLIGPQFAESRMKRFENTLLHHIETFCHRLHPSQTAQHDANHWGPVINMSHCCNYLIFDMLTEFMFGISYNLQQTDKYRYVVRCIEDAAIRSAILICLPYLAIWRLDRKIFKQSVDCTRALWKWIRRATDDNAKSGLTDNLFGYLSNPKDGQTEAPLSVQNIESEVGILIVAGKQRPTPKFLEPSLKPIVVS